MKEADMMKKICPIMSRARIDHSDVRNVTALAPGLILCQGSACLAFDSQPTQIFLAKDGKSETTMRPEILYLTDLLGMKPASALQGAVASGSVDQIDEINRHVANGWKRVGHGNSVHFTKPGEPNGWCDAMPANAQCGYEAP